MLKVMALWILGGTMFYVFISFKIFINQECPPKNIFNYSSKIHQSGFLRRWILVLPCQKYIFTIIHLILSSNVPTTYTITCYMRNTLIIYFETFNGNPVREIPLYTLFFKTAYCRLRTVNAHIRTPHLTVNITRLL